MGQFSNWSYTFFFVGDLDTKVPSVEIKFAGGFNMTNGIRNPNITADWVFDGNTTSTFRSLRIASFPTDDYGLDSSKSLNKDPRLQYAFETRPDANHSYTGYYLLDHGSCKPSETYQWGFSYIFLFMVSIFNFVWVCIMVGMWLDTRRGSMMYRSGRRPGLLRSIMDYSAAIREELGAEANYLEEDELRKRLTQSRGALVVEKRELRVTRSSTGETTKRGWKRGLTSGSTF